MRLIIIFDKFWLEIDELSKLANISGFIVNGKMLIFRRQSD